MRNIPLEISKFEESENKKLMIKLLKSGQCVYTCENGIPIMVFLEYFEEHPEKKYYININDCMRNCKPVEMGNK